MWYNALGGVTGVTVIYTGDGNVTGVPDNNVIIAKFTNEIESVTTLNCTVMYEDIRTDTVWTINKRDGNTIVHKDIQSLKGFNISGVEHETSEDLCENLLNISRDTLKGLDGTTVHCGSHMNHYQAKFDIHICGKLFQSRERS